MSYATIADLVERYGRRMLIDLTDRGDPPEGEVDAAVAQRALDDARAVIDGYVGTRYALPLPGTPPVLRDLAQAIAIYKLHRESAPEKIRDDHRGAFRSLQDIASGSLRLEIDGAEPATDAAGTSRASSAERVFTRQALDGHA